MPLPPLVMTDPVATGGVDDLLLEQDMEDDGAVDTTPAGVFYLAGASSSEDGEAPGVPPVDAAAHVLSGAPSGGLMSVCSGTTAPSASGAPRALSMRKAVDRLAGALSSPASRDVAGACSGARSSQDARPGGGDGSRLDGGGSTPGGAGHEGAGARAQGTPAAGEAPVSAGQDGGGGRRLPQEIPGVEVPPVGLGVLPELPWGTVGDDSASRMAVNGGSSPRLGPALLLPSRPRVAVPPGVAPPVDPVDVEVGAAGLPLGAAVLPGPARAAPLGGAVALPRGPPSLSIPDLVTWLGLPRWVVT